MSRCFPYPPPGFEAGPKSEQQHKDLLKKEKRKGEKHRREKDRGKRERKEKDRDHRKDKHSKKHKREKHRGSKNNEDRDKDKKQSLGPDTQKNCKHGNRKPEERGQNEAVKPDELVTQTFGQEASANHKCDNSKSLLPQSTDRKAKTMAVKGKDKDSVLKKRKTEYKNKEKEMDKNSTVNEHKHENLGARKNKVDNFMDLGFHNDKKFTSDTIKKRKDLSTNSSQHEHNMKTMKLPGVSPTKNEEICRHSQQIAPYSSTKLLGANVCGIGRDKPQDVYNNGTTGSHCSAEDIASVSSCGYRSNKNYLKQPHHDTKFLGQLYSLPPAQDFPDYIDQDWLFSQDHDERKTAAFEAAESDQVWSDAQLIDTADVIALPYVVPM